MQASQRRFAVADVRRMREVGILADEERVELVDGTLVPMSPESPSHRGVVADVAHALTLAYGASCRTWIQSMFILDRERFRVPDVVLVSGRIYDAEPSPSAVLLVVEVADSSLGLDLGDKAHEYCRWGVSTYWVVDLVSRSLIVHRSPSRGAYREIITLAEVDAVDLPSPAPQKRLVVRQILPPSAP